MSPVFANVGGAPPESPPRQAAKPALDASNARAAGAAWQSVFDRARAERPAHEAGAASDDGTPASRTASPPAVPRPCRDGARELAPPRPGAPGPQAAAPDERPGARAVAAAAIDPHATPQAAAPAPAVAAPRPATRPTPAGGRPDEAAHAPEARPAALADAAPPAQGECVSVFLHGDAVAVVVRDATLSDHAALHDAFAAARALGGADGALERLTLNGRPLYRRPPAAAETPPVAPLSFAC